MRRIRLATIALLLSVLWAGMAHATCSVPYSFSNNTVADATQVNANFTAAVACVNDFNNTAFGAAATPTITCGNAGSITTIAQNYQWTQKIGRIVWVHGYIGITTNGTCATSLNISVPYASVNNSNCGSFIFNGNIALGAALHGGLNCNDTVVKFQKYDATYPGSSGAVIAYSGWYESDS